MKHRPRPPEQNDLFWPRLADMIDMRHELLTPAGLIDWEYVEREWAGFFPSTTGRPATSPRLVAGLLNLQHAFRLSDEAVVARWVAVLCGYGHNIRKILAHLRRLLAAIITLVLAMIRQDRFQHHRIAAA